MCSATSCVQLYLSVVCFLLDLYWNFLQQQQVGDRRLPRRRLARSVLQLINNTTISYFQPLSPTPTLFVLRGGGFAAHSRRRHECRCGGADWQREQQGRDPHRSVYCARSAPNHGRPPALTKKSPSLAASEHARRIFLAVPLVYFGVDCGWHGARVRRRTSNPT